MGPEQALADTAGGDTRGCVATLACDQAVFTSIRTPMGEGYRIIASSRGLRAVEKQMITRSSPSHEGLCRRSPEAGVAASGPEGAAFYRLPSGRLCVALSCFAGAEHTGRGGQRVYTQCAVFDEDSFPQCGYNAFNVLRAMVAAGLAAPRLEPSATLPPIALVVNAGPDDSGELTLHPEIGTDCRRRVLQGLFDNRSMIVDVEGEWLQSAELLLLGVPGPARADISFSAGARFSLGRGHRLHLLHDARGEARARTSGQPVDFIKPGEETGSGRCNSAWMQFVEHCWSRSLNAMLAERTSRPFSDVGPAARERVGRLYNAIDGISETHSARLVDLSIEQLRSAQPAVEGEIARELVERAGAELVRRITAERWSDVKRYWPKLIEMYGRPGQPAAFALPLLEQALCCAMRDDPLDAATTALDLTLPAQPCHDTSAVEAMCDRVIKRLVAWAPTASGTERERLLSLCDRWRPLRPDCALIDDVIRISTSPVTAE
ncbi:MAG: hypothetical protein ACE5HE_06530 [Phycisphaerae bacterium]